MPSQGLADQINLPTPTGFVTPPTLQRLSVVEKGENFALAPLAVITTAFNRQPQIKSSYHRFKSEEARYDFFYTSRDSLTPQLSVSNNFQEAEFAEGIDRSRDHTTTFSIEKRFFDTTQLDVGVGYRLTDENVGNADQPFAVASIRYPLWASRERLERTSEEIFRRNELNDAQLEFIQTVREQLSMGLFFYYEAVFNMRQRDDSRSRIADLQALLKMLDTIQGRDLTADRSRIEAEIASVRSEERNADSRAAVLVERLKGTCGLSFNAQVEIVDEPFDPFQGMSHEDLLRLGVETDPEIATLRNAMNNAQVQLDLARQGTWDIALLLNGETSLEGDGQRENLSDWSVTAGFEVSKVDSRVTDSLIRQAQSDIERFGEAIAARENTIFVDTFEPLIRNRSLGLSMRELTENLEKFERDYATGIEEYRAGTLNIDDLLNRRDEINEQQEDISRQARNIGFNISSLCAATGKFFELLNRGQPQIAKPPTGEAEHRSKPDDDNS